MFRNYQFALDEIRDARDAFAAIEFNSRDYYVQGAGAWEAAVEERDAQFTAFDAIIKYLEDHIISIDSQIEARKRKSV